eukprot:TRINITY_DN7_c0_g1_i1.p1 TRINITY_DN7_c0_g1~~TRINITY_DN7_c0_g1_i1.p1  ORF type:complete len:129 (-),score=28.32 TRINITY_DN7_c0_g1_i1:38-424(-)
MADLPVLTAADVKKHNTEKDCWLIIHDLVYDVTSFLDDHPGGVDTLLDQAGGNATDEFEAVGHSNQAVELMKKYVKGRLEGGVPKPTPAPRQNADRPSNGSGNGILPIAVIVAVVAVALSLKFFVFKQ